LSRVWTFVVGAELAVQSQHRPMTPHPQLQPALSSAGTDTWVLSWRLNKASDSSGDRRAIGSRFQVLGPYAALASRRPSPRHQEGCGDCTARLATTIYRRRRHIDILIECLYFNDEIYLLPAVSWLPIVLCVFVLSSTGTQCNASGRSSADSVAWCSERKVNLCICVTANRIQQYHFR